MARKVHNDIFFGLDLNDEQKEFRNAIYGNDYDILFCNSMSGSGKTTISVASAKLLVSQKKYDGLVYIFNPTEEDKCGFRPGNQIEKERVYWEPLIGALIKINEQPERVINQLAQDMNIRKNDESWVDAVSHTFMRGINIENKVIIIDEAQNFTLKELKKTLTRIHDNSKIILIGHDGQCDLPDESTSGFVRYLEHFKSMPRCKICNLTENFRGWISNHADNLIDKEIQVKEEILNEGDEQSS